MRISFSGSDGGMSHQILDDADGNILFHQPGGKGVPEGVDIDPLQFTALTNGLYPFLVGPGIGIGPPPGGKEKIQGVGLSLVELDLPVEHKQPPDVLIHRCFPVTGFTLGGFLEDQFGFLAGGIIEQLHPFQILADADGPLLLIEIAPLQGKDLPHPCPGKERKEHRHPQPLGEYFFDKDLHFFHRQHPAFYRLDLREPEVGGGIF